MIRKLGENCAFPFFFQLTPGLPSSVMLEEVDDGSNTRNSRRLCGVFYEILVFPGKDEVRLVCAAAAHHGAC